MSMIRRFIALRWQDKLLVVEALASLALSRLVTRFLPFNRAVQYGSLPIKTGSIEGGDDIVSRVVGAVNLVADRVPFRAVCFQRSLAVQSMLRRRSIDARLHYGVGYGGGDLSAHVWVSVGRDIIVGERTSERHVELVTTP